MTVPQYNLNWRRMCGQDMSSSAEHGNDKGINRFLRRESWGSLGPNKTVNDGNIWCRTSPTVDGQVKKFSSMIVRSFVSITSIYSSAREKN